MANQMIALQARNPQLPDPAQRTARLANMMNMARQTEAAQLQGERLRQEMDYAQAGETRAAATHTSAQKKAELEYVGLAAEQFRQDVAKIREGDVAGYEAARADIVSKIPSWANYIRPASEWTPDYAAQLMSKASEIVAQTYPEAKSVIEYAAKGGVDAQGRPVPEGTPIQVVTGRRPSTTPIPAAGGAAATPAPTAPQPAPAGPAPTGKFGETRVVDPESIPLTPYQQEHIREMQSGLGMSQPASFTRGAGAEQMTPQMAQQIVDTAVKTGMMAQADFDQLMAMAPEQNKQPFMDMLKANNIALQPGGAGQQSQFADLRGQRMQSQTAGLRGAPPMEQTLAQYQPLQVRDPRVPVAPGSSVVPLGRLGAEKTTEAQATADVNLRMAPEIAKATKLAERAVEKRSEALVAKNETKSAIQSIDKYIEEIDALLRSPDRRFIVGRIEGNLHYLGSLGQNERQAELQAMYDRIKNADTLGSLVEAKQATPTGGSPVGNASNLDVQLIAKSANSLTQTGGVPKFDEDLKKLRREAYRTRQRRIEFYNDRYGDLSAEDPKFKLTVRPIADRYISSKDLPKTRTPVQRKASGGFTVVRVED